MKLSKTLWQTHKETPKDAEIVSHQLLLRAGLLHKTSAGLFTYLPFAMKSMSKIKNIIREEMEKIDATEISLSLITPAEIWQRSGRWQKMGPEMLRFQDRTERDLCFSPTNEEAVTDVFQKQVKSYKQLPLCLYQMNTKFRDEIRPRFGLMRAKEFLMKDAYSFHSDQQCLNEYYQKMYQAYQNIFQRIGLQFMIVKADAGAMGSAESQTHEFQVLAQSGEDSLLYTEDGSYASNTERAEGQRANVDFRKSENSLQKVATENLSTIEEVAEFLKVRPEQCLKSLVYQVVKKGKLTSYLILLLGDDELNEVKLKNLTGADEIYPASEQDLAKAQLVAGSIGPVNLACEMKVIFDQQIEMDAHYVVGANEKNFHFTDFRPSRDLAQKPWIVDVRCARSADLATNGQPLLEARGIEVGHIFQLGDQYTKSMAVDVLDQNGKRQYPLMGCYGIGVSRTMAAAIEQCHDANGIIWPKAIAPFDVYLAAIVKTDEFKKVAEDVYHLLVQSHYSVLFDDRQLGPGPMFKDADLLGLPIRVTVGERDYQQTQKLEIKLRHNSEVIHCRQEELIATLDQLWKTIP